MKLTSLLAAALVAASALTASADVINFAGTTSGEFSVTGLPVYQELSFVGDAFNKNTTASGNASLNLGTFTLAPQGDLLTDSYTGTFNLEVTFTAPAGTSGSPATIVGDVTGEITVNDGFLNITFGAATPFTFANGVSSGSFVFYVNNVDIEPLATGPRIVQLTGGVRSASEVVPDGGATAALLGCSFIGLAYVRNRFALLKA